MSNVIDDYEKRKSLRRSRFRWRVIALIAVLVAIGTVMAQWQRPIGAHLARYEVTGVIVDDTRRDALLKSIAEDDEATALLLHINSPGGTVTGSEALYESLREIAETKPVVATMGEVAASGGYIAALAADHIVARGNTITGSVGVVFQAPNAHGLMEKLGVSMVEIKSGKLKAQPTPFKPVAPEVIAAEKELVDDSFNWFLDLVRTRREMGENAIAKIRDGGVFTGRMAEKIGLIDALGNADEARQWLQETHDIPEDLAVVEYEVRDEPAGPFGLFGSWLPALPALKISESLGGGLLAIYR